MKFRFAIAASLALLLTTACGSAQERPRKPPMDAMLAQLTEQDGRACIRQGDIRGFAPLSDELVSVSARRNKHYLVTTLFTCWSLTSSLGVAFSGNFAEVCGGGGDEIITSDESCTIKHIYEFASREDAMATVKAAEARREALVLFPGQESARDPEPESGTEEDKEG